MPVKRMKKQSKKRGGGMLDFLFTGKDPAVKENPLVNNKITESAVGETISTESVVKEVPASEQVPAVKEVPASEQVPAVKEVPAVVPESNEVNNPKTDEVGKSEVEQGTVLEEPKTKSSWWPFSGGKSRRKRSKKGAKGSSKKRSSKKRSSKGSAKRCSKKNCKSRKHKH